MQTYLFYDIETTGLNKSFDQVLQFAAIRTDMNLRELERYELNVKLNSDVIPAPKAVITHHIGIKESQSGISEIEALKQIHQWMNTKGTISLGYNTLGFDDEFLRFSFYRNLLSPYTHQYANQCGRMDLYPIAQMYYLFKNHVLAWPKKNDSVSLKLEELNNANNLASGRAHNAMVDVEATLALAHLFFKEQEMWNYIVGYFNKQKDLERSQQSSGLMIYGKFGSLQNFLCPVLFLGHHRHYKNQMLWLRLDLENLSHTTPDSIKETTWVMHKKLGEPGFILPQKERYWEHVSSTALTHTEINKKWLQHHPDMLDQITQYHANYLYPVYPDTDIEASLYLNSFWTDEENLFCRRFHAAATKEKALMTENLKNPKLQSLAIRLLGRHYPDVMTENQIERFAEYTEKIGSPDDSKTLIDFRGEKRRTSQNALQEISTLRNTESLSHQQIMLLDELENYILTHLMS